MRILIVAATEAEMSPLVAELDGTRRSPLDGARAFQASGRSSNDIDILTTGVGMVATAARTARALAQTRYDLALNFGVCGSFDRALAPGSVVHVVTDGLPELGAEDDEAFLTLEDLKLLAGGNQSPFHDGRLTNEAPPPNEVLSRLPAVHGITVNTVHGNDASIAAILRRCDPQVETMEGAAFMYACLIHQRRFAQVRAVSNAVETRNRGAWKMAEAIYNLGRTALEILDHV